MALGLAAVAAFLAFFLAGWILADWLRLPVVLAVVLMGVSAVLYAETILVVEEDATTWEAFSDSIGVLTERWKEALRAPWACSSPFFPSRSSGAWR